jgi:hypothetical protein
MVKVVVGPPDMGPPIICPAPALIRILEAVNILSILSITFFSVPFPRESINVRAVIPIIIPTIMKKVRILWRLMTRNPLFMILLLFIPALLHQ